MVFSVKRSMTLAQTLCFSIPSSRFSIALHEFSSSRGKLVPRIFFIKLLYMKHMISLAAHSSYWFVYLCIYWKVSVEVMGLCIVKTFQVLMSWWDSILQAHSWWLQQYSRYILQDIVSESYISLRLDVKAISCRWIVKKKSPIFFSKPFPLILIENVIR